MTEEEKREAYVRTVFAGNDGDVFTRSDLRAYIEEAWSAGYNEGARDFGDTVTNYPFPLSVWPTPLSRFQADKLAKEFEALNEICKDSGCRDALIKTLFEEAEKQAEAFMPRDLIGSVEYFGDKLKLLRLKSNERTDGKQQSNS